MGWNRSSRELFYRNGNKMMVVDVSASAYRRHGRHAVPCESQTDCRVVPLPTGWAARDVSWRARTANLPAPGHEELSRLLHSDGRDALALVVRHNRQPAAEVRLSGHHHDR